MHVVGKVSDQHVRHGLHIVSASFGCQGLAGAWCHRAAGRTASRLAAASNDPPENVRMVCTSVYGDCAPGALPGVADPVSAIPRRQRLCRGAHGEPPVRRRPRVIDL
jgi:hypothetical protein